MCEFHGSNGNRFGDIWWTDNPIYFSSIDVLKANLNLCGSLIVAILSGGEFQFVIVPWQNVTVFAGVDGIECFAIEMSSASKIG